MAMGVALAEDLPHELEAGAESVVGGGRVVVGANFSTESRSVGSWIAED